MIRKLLIIPLAGLILFLGWWNIRRFMSADSVPANAPAAAPTSARAENLPVRDPRLRLDKLRAVQQVEYRGTKRNIFDYYIPPPPIAPQPTQLAAAATQPPLQVPLRFYGVVEEGGGRKALLTDGEEVYVVAAGDVVLRRFRVVRIGPNAIEFEDVGDRRRAVLPLEEGGP
jgi:ribosome-associated protein YbcJ (S4-like RNA binding protein)